jgi:hypothetical protein
MDDRELLTRIHGLVDEEHELRERFRAGELRAGEEQARLRSVEVALDQCWDVLRQRRAKRRAGQDPEEARTRPATEVESYLQ